MGGTINARFGSCVYGSRDPGHVHHIQLNTPSPICAELLYLRHTFTGAGQHEAMERLSANEV